LSSRDVSKDEKYNFEVLFQRHIVENSNNLPIHKGYKT